MSERPVVAKSSTSTCAVASCPPEFTDHPAVINGCSDLLAEVKELKLARRGRLRELEGRAGLRFVEDI